MLVLHNLIRDTTNYFVDYILLKLFVIKIFKKYIISYISYTLNSINKHTGIYIFPYIIIL